MLSPEKLAHEIGLALPPSADMSIEQSRYWCKVFETFTDDQFLSFIRVAEAAGSPMSILLRHFVLQKQKAEANVQ